MSISKWLVRWLYCIMIILINCSISIAEQRKKDMSAEVERKYKALEQSANENATVTYMNASAPIGRLLLIRNGKDCCAVRFTEFHRGHDAKPSTIFNSGDETLYAEYDWYFQGDGSGDFTKSNVKSGHEKLKRGPMVGIGRFSFQIGTTAISCGPFSLSWIYPNNVGFHLSNTKEDDIGNELAPTKWKDLHEIDIREPRVRWYRFDEKRKDIIIPVDHLW